jgi:RimJ/RimL family protein N-acetyltransferase
MALYHDIIKDMKENGSINFKKFQIENKKISLQVIDNSDETAELCLEWRNKYWQGFDTKFKGSVQRTKKWITEEILNNSNRIFFMILVNERKIGHFGICNFNDKDSSIWFESAVNGEKIPGIMEIIEKELIKWVFEQIKVSKIKIKLFSDNIKPINLHERCGFLTTDTFPIKRIFRDDGWKWEDMEIKSNEEFGERYFNIMELTKKRWDKRNNKTL